MQRWTTKRTPAATARSPRFALCLAAALGLALAASVGRAQPRDPADPGVRAEPPPVQRPGLGPPGGPGARVPERIDPALRFSSRDRELFASWAASEYGRGNCPPGLAKKDGACIPRGQSHKRFKVGYPLPAGAVPGPVPLDLTQRIGVPPRGYRYGMIDGDLVKIATDSSLVVDAIDGFIPK